MGDHGERIMADKRGEYTDAKEVVLKKRYRVFVRDDNGTVIGIYEELFEYTPIVTEIVQEWDDETGELISETEVVTGGDFIPKEEYLTDFGTSTTTTWVTGKYYENDKWEKVLDKYMKKEMDTNA